MSDQIGGQLPWGIESKQLQPGSMKTISESKLANFAIGNQKKSRFQKAREEKELKKRQEEEEAAKVYDQFVASFEVTDGSKSFIRGGKTKESDENNIYGGARGEVYRLEDRTKTAGSEMQRMFEEIKERNDDRSQRVENKQTITLASPKSLTNSSVDKVESFKDKDDVKPNVPAQMGSVSALNTGIVRSTSASDKNKNIDDFLQELMSKHEPSSGGPVAIVPPNPTPAPGLAALRMISEPTLADLDKGSFDNGDPETTNLYCGNLAPTITEELLYEIFGKFGAINSVKVMWPRTEEERLRKRNCGFVSFMNRRDAEDAKLELHDSIVEGYRMTVGWGKAVKINAVPFKLPSASAISSAPLPPNATGLPVGALPVQVQRHPTAGAVSTDPYSEADPKPADVEPAEREMTSADEATAVRVLPPPDPRIRALIDVTAKFVAIDGDAFEQSLRSRDEGNPDFSFISAPDSSFGQYYRWRTYAYIMGDEDSWRDRPFQMVQGGPFWVPPPSPTDPRRSARDRRGDDDDMQRRRSLSPDPREGKDRRSRSRDRDRDRRRSRSVERDRDSDARRRSRSPDKDRAGHSSKVGALSERYAGMTGAQIERLRAKERGSRRASLSNSTYDEFEEMLHRLNVGRESIVQAMGLALDNVDAAEEVVGILKESLVIQSTPFPVKVARLYLLSDILHNSGCHVKNASNYRMHIQACLPDVFESLGATLRAASGRMSAKQIIDRVQGVLDVWSQWAVFPPMFLMGLEATLMRTEAEAQTISALALTDSEGDLESLKKKARLHGISTTTSSVAELVAKMSQVADYARRKVMGLGSDTRPGGGHILGDVFLGGGPSPWQMAQGDDDGRGRKSDDDIDGAPLDVDGIPLDDVDGEPLDDVDGDPLDDVDGVPLDDLDGEPLDDAVAMPMDDPKFRRPATTSASTQRWESVDDPKHTSQRPGSSSGSEDSSDKGDGPGRIVIDSDDDRISPKKVSRPDVRGPVAMSEERKRAMLRATEAALLGLRDELEAQSLSPEEVEAALARERVNLLAAWDKDERRTERGAADPKEKESSATRRRLRSSSSDSDSSSSDSSARERRLRLREREREQERGRDRDRGGASSRSRGSRERNKRSPSSSSSSPDRGRPSTRPRGPAGSTRHTSPEARNRSREGGAGRRLHSRSDHRRERETDLRSRGRRDSDDRADRKRTRRSTSSSSSSSSEGNRRREARRR